MAEGKSFEYHPENRIPMFLGIPKRWPRSLEPHLGELAPLGLGREMLRYADKELVHAP